MITTYRFEFGKLINNCTKRLGITLLRISRKFSNRIFLLFTRAIRKPDVLGNACCLLSCCTCRKLANKMESTSKQDEHGEEHFAVLPGKMGGGPHGLGDPNDRSLRKVEIEILIPKKIRSKAKADKCAPEVQAFEECCKSSGIAMVVTCRKENAALKTCLTHWYQDDELKKECTDEYLKERSYYRATGIRKRFARM